MLAILKRFHKRGLAILAVLFVAYTVVVFAAPFHRNGLFWISYLFTLPAFGMQVYTFCLAFSGRDGLKSKLYGFPIARISVVYLEVQVVASLVFMGLSTRIPRWIAIVAYVLMLAFAVVGIIADDVMRYEIVRQDVKLKANVGTMRAMQSQIGMLSAQCELEELKPTLTSLAEEFRFSDPVSSEALTGIEADLMSNLNELGEALASTEPEAARTLCKKISALLKERNRLCKLNK